MPFCVSCNKEHELCNRCSNDYRNKITTCYGCDTTGYREINMGRFISNRNCGCRNTWDQIIYRLSKENRNHEIYNIVNDMEIKEENQDIVYSCCYNCWDKTNKNILANWKNRYLLDNPHEVNIPSWIKKSLLTLFLTFTKINNTEDRTHLPPELIHKILYFINYNHIGRPKENHEIGWCDKCRTCHSVIDAMKLNIQTFYHPFVKELILYNLILQNNGSNEIRIFSIDTLSQIRDKFRYLRRNYTSTESQLYYINRFLHQYFSIHNRSIHPN